VVRFRILDRHSLKDSPPTVARCQLLLERVLSKLQQPVQPSDRLGRTATPPGTHFPTVLSDSLRGVP
jgi:hypothetical protein